MTTRPPSLHLHKIAEAPSADSLASRAAARRLDSARRRQASATDRPKSVSFAPASARPPSAAFARPPRPLSGAHAFNRTQPSPFNTMNKPPPSTPKPPPPTERTPVPSKKPAAAEKIFTKQQLNGLAEKLRAKAAKTEAVAACFFVAMLLCVPSSNRD